MKAFARFLCVLSLTAFCVACGGGGGAAPPPPPAAPPPPPAAPPGPPPIARGNIEIRLTLVAEGFASPVWGTHAPNDSTRLFVVDQIGTVESIDLSTGQVTPFLNVSNRILHSQDLEADERGFLGLAFHPGYASNGLLYTFTSEPDSGVTDFPLPIGRTPDHQSVIAEWRVNNPANPGEVVDATSRRELLRIDQPYSNHNAGALVFDNDGFLLISLGDGGSLGDPDGNSQNTANLLGAILRIDPDGNNSSNGNYGIPTTNPFIGLPGFLDEVFAFGFRNPFRISVDRISGDLWVGDVGENNIEEVDRVTAGGNYGWNTKEGSFCVTGSTITTDPSRCDSTGLNDPVAEYDHTEGIAVIGGFVYRGSRLDNLVGRYVFGDFVGTGPFFDGSGRLFYLDGSTIFEFGLSDRIELGGNLTGFGEDADGELYVMTVALGVSSNSGQVYRIDPP